MRTPSCIGPSTTDATVSLPLLLPLLLSLLAPAADSRTFIDLLQGAPGGASAAADGNGAYCESWKFSVETNDAGPWHRIPARCVDYVEGYMEGPRYAADCEVASRDAIEYAMTVGALRSGAGGGKRAWIFDVDETLLSNLPYYIAVGFGSVFNEPSFDVWVDQAAAPAIPSSLKLYNQLLQLGYSLVLLTGRSEYQRNVTEKNLLVAGYRNWDMLILRGPSDQGKHAVLYKSEKRAWLVSEGYKIYGSSGDQWSDLLGWPAAQRSFKLPNPTYYVA